MRTWRVGSVVAVACAFTGTALARSSSTSQLLDVPAGAILVAKTNVEEVRGFPEMSGTEAARKAALTARQTDLNGVDRLYRSDRSYPATVAYFDSRFSRPRLQTLARTETATSTAWTVRKPNGTITNAIVRNTTPATFEIEEATAPLGVPLQH